MADIFLALTVIAIGLNGLAIAIAIRSEQPNFTFAAMAWYLSVMSIAVFIGIYV